MVQASAPPTESGRFGWWNPYPPADAMTHRSWRSPSRGSPPTLRELQVSPGCGALGRAFGARRRHRCRPRAASSRVLAAWQLEHRPCPLAWSWLPPSATGTTWSASVAGAPHGQVGSRRRMARRTAGGNPLLWLPDQAVITTSRSDDSPGRVARGCGSCSGRRRPSEALSEIEAGQRRASQAPSPDRARRLGWRATALASAIWPGVARPP